MKEDEKDFWDEWTADLGKPSNGGIIGGIIGATTCDINLACLGVMAGIATSALIRTYGPKVKNFVSSCNNGKNNDQIENEANKQS